MGTPTWEHLLCVNVGRGTAWVWNTVVACLRASESFQPPSLPRCWSGGGRKGRVVPHSSLLTIQEVSGNLTLPFPTVFVVPLPLGSPRKIGFKYPTKKSVVSYNLEEKKKLVSQSSKKDEKEKEKKQRGKGYSTLFHLPLSELANRRVRVLELLDSGPPQPQNLLHPPCGFSGHPCLLSFLGNPGKKLISLMCGELLGFPLLPGLCYGMWPGR